MRGVSNAENRVREAQRLGFKRCVLPKQNLKNIDTKSLDIELIGIRQISEAFDFLKKA